MSYYLPTVLIEAVGLTNRMARLLSAVNSVTYFIFSCAAIFLIERWGRRGLMLLSTAGQGLAFLVITILLARNDVASGDQFATASIPFFFFYYIAFGLGMLGIPWLYPTEINSLPMRTKGAAIATMTNWLANFVVVQITPIGIRNLGWRFWIVFTVFNAVCIPIIYFLYPETANRSLEDMDDYFRGNPSVIVTKEFDAISQRRPERFVERERAALEREREVERKRVGVEMEGEEGKGVGNGVVSHLEVDRDEEKRV
jgi:MFS family permease